LRSDLDIWDVGYLRVQGFYSDERDSFLAFSKELTSTPMTAPSWNSPRRRICGRPTTELTKDYDALSYRLTAVVKSKPLAIPEAMHHYYMAQSYLAA